MRIWHILKDIIETILHKANSSRLVLGMLRHLVIISLACNGEIQIFFYLIDVNEECHLRNIFWQAQDL